MNHPIIPVLRYCTKSERSESVKLCSMCETTVLLSLANTLYLGRKAQMIDGTFGWHKSAAKVPRPRGGPSYGLG